jgi:hypothetical protein
MTGTRWAVRPEMNATSREIQRHIPDHASACQHQAGAKRAALAFAADDLRRKHFLPVTPATAPGPNLLHGRRHRKRGGDAMWAYLKAVAITVSLLGAWLALLPLVA